MARLGFGDARIFDDPQIQARVAAIAAANVPTIPTLDAVPAAVADVNLHSHKLTNVTDPASAQDAATKNYVDARPSGLVHSQLGKTTTTGGGNTYAAAKTALMPITLAAPGLIASVSAFGAPTGVPCRLAGVIYTDDGSGNTPNLLKMAGISAKVANGGANRWWTVPLGIWVPAGLYYVGVGAVTFGSGFQIVADTAAGGAWIRCTDPVDANTDGSFCDWAGSSTNDNAPNRNYSIYANVLS